LAQHRNRRSGCPYWAVPGACFIATYLLAAGASLSNVDVRSQVETAGLIVLAAIATLGWLIAWRGGAAPFGRAINMVLVAIVLVLVATAVLAPAPLREVALLRPKTEAPPQPLPVWIDRDIACRSGKTADVDDCWALALELRSPEFDVRGIRHRVRQRRARRWSSERAPHRARATDPRVVQPFGAGRRGQRKRARIPCA
jgi:hypothetical protein